MVFIKEKDCKTESNGYLVLGQKLQTRHWQVWDWSPWCLPSADFTKTVSDWSTRRSVNQSEPLLYMMTVGVIIAPCMFGQRGFLTSLSNKQIPHQMILNYLNQYQLLLKSGMAEMLTKEYFVCGWMFPIQSYKNSSWRWDWSSHLSPRFNHIYLSPWTTGRTSWASNPRRNPSITNSFPTVRN